MSSVASDDSFERSDVGSDVGSDGFSESDNEFGEFGDAMASPERVRAAYHSQAVLPDTLPNGHVGGRRHLRKNETSYANRPGDAILPGYGARDVRWYDDSEQFGMLAPLGEDGREVVGTYYDASGQPIAKIVESKPPPPNANYSHMVAGAAHRLNRAQGLDPDAFSKTEVVGITNGEDNVYGEAMITGARHHAAVAAQARLLHGNQKHTEAFAEQDLSRADIYDGLNMKAPHCKRTPRLEHTWRATLHAPQSPDLPQAATARRALHGEARATRTETSQPFARRPHMHSSIEQINPSTLPLPVATVHTQRLDKDTSDAATLAGEAAVDTSTRRPCHAARALPAPELSAPTPSGVAQAGADGARVQGRRALPVKARQQHNEHAHSHTDAPHVPGPKIEARGVQRAGSDDAPAKRLHDHGTSHTAARRALPLNGSRTLSADDVRVHTKLIRSAAAVPASVVHGKAVVEGTDAVRVQHERSETHAAGDRARSMHDTPLPERSELKPGQPRVGASAVAMRSVAPIGDDRPPTHEAAAWYGGLTYGMAEAAMAARRADEEVDQLTTARGNEAHDAARPATGVAQPAHRPCTTTTALSGTRFIDDRLAQPLPAERSRVDQRVQPSTQLTASRATPVMTLYGGEPTLNQRPSLGAVQSSGRETPVRFGAATLGMAA